MNKNGCICKERLENLGHNSYRTGGQHGLVSLMKKKIATKKV